jgi:FkbM family methyltransferase
MIDDVRSQARNVASLLRMRELSPRARLGLLGLAARRRLRPPHVATWAFGPGRIELAPRQTPDVDWRVLSEVFLSGVYETDFTDAGVVDAGAHKGYFAAYALARGAAAVVSVEPESQNFAALARSAASVPARGRWTTHRSAVKATDGEALLAVASESWAHRTVAPGTAPAGRTEAVPAVSLGRLLDEVAAHGCARLIVKLDVEGDECDIVLATPHAVWQAVDEVFLEMHAFAPCSAADLALHLGAAGIAHADTRRGEVLHFIRERGGSAPAPRIAPTGLGPSA